jgi:tRNA(Ile)-lysidine synthase
VAPADLQGLISGELDLRLERDVARPIAIALSGGGDSLALLLSAKVWAGSAGRPLVALTVDHRLQSESARWTGWCAERAGRLGVAHRRLIWDGEKPATGLAAAARGARHRLIAKAARGAGARVVLFGHTADDEYEARAMRAEGVRIGSLRPWSPSPVWPEGRDLFIARPLLGARRAEIRTWLADRGETWIEDPANADLRHPRARARKALAGARFGDGASHAWAVQGAPMFGTAGEIILPFGTEDGLGEAVACASGAERPPRGEAVARLAERLGNGAKSATLGGARIVRKGERLHISREARDRRGRACEALALPVGETMVWDGRFEATAHAPGLVLRPQGSLAAPSLQGDPRVTIRNLVPGRMAGACGLIQCEADIGLLG